MDNEDGEPTLPCQPRRRDSSPTLPTIPKARGLSGISSRKRLFGGGHKEDQHQHQLATCFNTSSDPAFFSSDENPDLENYSGSKRRKKKVYSGTWWGGRLRPSTVNRSSSSENDSVAGSQHLPYNDGDSRKKDRKFRRNFDSGIFMADDSTGTASDLSSDGLLEDLRADQQRVVSEQRREGVHKKNDSLSSISLTGHDSDLTPRRKFKIYELEKDGSHTSEPIDRLIAQRVESCLERGCPDVDLTGLDIKTVPATVGQLTALVKQMPRASGEYTDLSLHPRIYLGNNQLSHFPAQIFNVPAIELLSVRQNNLTNIPDEIADLRDLKELNVAGNQLEYLPFSILRRFERRHLHEIQSEPNPWRKIPPRDQQLPEYPRLIHRQPTQRMWRVAVEPATELGANGLEKKRAPIARVLGQMQYRQTAAATVPRTRAQYLSELVLRNLRNFVHPDQDLSTSEEVEGCPENVKNMLHELYIAQQSGQHECTFCGRRDMVLPRYQWIEWWGRSVFSRAPSAEESEHVAPYGIIRDAPLERASHGAGSPGEDQRQHDDVDNGVTVDANDHERDHDDTDNANDAETKILPFMRKSCGCRTQIEGLDEEKSMYEALERDEELIKEYCADRTDRPGDVLRSGWPRLMCYLDAKSGPA